MGTPLMSDGARKPAAISRFYSSDAWVEGRAEDQLTHLAALDGVSRVAAFPDLHPGKYGPVGCAALSSRLYPLLIGNDIGCGMALFALDLPVRKLKAEKAAARLRALEGTWDGDAGARLEAVGLPADLFADALGTIGGGNHFCEVQIVEETDDPAIDRKVVWLLVHSGSRGLGNAVLSALPEGAVAGFAPDSAEAQAYLAGHDRAVTWAALNRRIIADRAAEALRADLMVVTDAAHNLVRPWQGGWLHRKGAAEAGPLVPLAGSRATLSYLMAPGEADTLGSLAHGAGRKYDRSSMHGRVRAKKSDLMRLQRTALGGHVVCEDRDLLIEEAPEAYKSSDRVVADLEATGAARRVAAFRPVVTFKKARAGA